MDWYSKFIVPIWKEYKLPGFVAIGVLVLAAAYVFGVDLGGAINAFLARLSGL